MTARPHLSFYHWPQSRAAGVRVLLEELQADYEVVPLNLQNGDQRKPAYLAVNPMGKVPAIVHEGVLITEQTAIYQYLAELHPARQLAPAPGDARRGPYLRWLAFYGSCFEPAVVDRALKREAGKVGMSPYGDFDTMFATLVAQIEAEGEFFLGSQFTSLDVLWAMALQWMTKFGLVSATPKMADYVARITARPAAERARQLDAALLASLGVAS